MMKYFAIITLILMFWCNQSSHHVFLFMSTSPLGLATEEFIPVDANVPLDELSNAPRPPQKSLHIGSQNDKSDSVNTEQGSHRSPTEVDLNSVPSVDSSTDSEKTVNVPLDPEVPSSSETTSPSPASILAKTPNSETDPVVNTANPTNIPHNNVPSSNVPSAPPPSQNSNDLNDSDQQQGSVPSLQPILTGRDNNETIHSVADQHKLVLESHEHEDTPPIPPNAAEEPIPSFMEWTQQKLHESNLAQAVTGSGQANGQNGHKSSQTANSQQNKSSHVVNQTPDDSKERKEKETNAKNFASPDCGAKVIQSNPESQNANGVLSSSNDEYMLNKCGIPIWFVVELCEPLKMEKVSLGNLELFSSSPKDIEIGISDRYPTREWTKLGPFTLPDIRGIHTFDFPATNASTFGKFLKVNVLSHYGAEHYCPLSLVKVNGISEYEVLESENIHPEDINTAEKEESALYEEPIIMEEKKVEKNTGNDKSVFGSAKDAVINIVKKAAQVLVKSGNNKEGSSDLNNDPSCRSINQCLPNYESNLKDQVLMLLSCNFSDLLPFLSKNAPWCGWDYCHALFNKHSIGLPWQPEGFYASIFGGPSVLHALCNYHRPLYKESCEAFLVANDSATSNDGSTLSEDYNNKSLKSPPIATIELGTSIHEPSSDKPADPVQEPKEGKENGKMESNDNQAGSENVNKDSQQNTADASQQQIVKEGEPILLPGATVNNGDSAQQASNSQPSTTQSDSINQPEDNSQHQQQNNNHQQQQQPASNQQQKESVFVRLSNRIKTLERNSSLTASYLEELSRRFKKQNEENSQFNEGSRRFINESRTKFKTLEDLYKVELRSLRRNTDEIRERLFNVQLQRSVLVLLCLIQFLGIVFVCMWARRRFRQLEERLECSTSLIRQQPQTVTPNLLPLNRRSSLRSSESPHSVVMGRKRINSDGSVASSISSFDKSKKIKRKKKKLVDLKPVNIKTVGPLSAPIEYLGNQKDEIFKFDHPSATTSISALKLNSTSNFKENIKPEPNSEVVPETNKLSSYGSETNLQTKGRFSILPTKVDSPFSMIPATATNFYPDSGVSTSSRFALLASPGPGVTKSTNLKRSGSLSSIDHSSVSSYGDKTGVNSLTNGHGDNQSQGSNGSGKKRRNKGLKALMPKIFDR